MSVVTTHVLESRRRHARWLTVRWRQLWRCEIHTVGVPATVAEPDVLRSQDGELFRLSVPTTATTATAADVCSSTAEPTAAKVMRMSSPSAAPSG